MRVCEWWGFCHRLRSILMLFVCVQTLSSEPAHNSTLSFAQILAGGQPAVQTLRVDGLPYSSINFLSDNSLVATGWENRPHLYTAAGAAAEPSWCVFARHGNISVLISHR